MLGTISRFAGSLGSKGCPPKSVKLDEHVGYQVTVTGSAQRESRAEEKAEEKKEGQMEKAAGKVEYGDLRDRSEDGQRDLQQMRTRSIVRQASTQQCWPFFFEASASATRTA